MKYIFRYLIIICYFFSVLPVNATDQQNEKVNNEVIAVFKDNVIYLLPLIEKSTNVNGDNVNNYLSVGIPIDSEGNLSVSFPQIGAGWDSSYSIYATISYTTQNNPHNNSQMRITSISGGYIDQEPTVSVFSQKIEAGQNVFGGTPNVIPYFPVASKNSFTYYPSFNYISRTGSSFIVNYWLTIGRSASRTWSLWIQDGVLPDASI